MKITAISDLHGYEPELPGGDLLIVAGDCTAGDKFIEWGKFFEWFEKQKYTHKVLVGGNHDNFLVNGFPKGQIELDELNDVQAWLVRIHEMEKPFFTYLCDSGIELVTDSNRLKIWGTPWTPWFQDVDSRCKAFMLKEAKLKAKFDLIPEGLDILISHGPPHRILDRIIRYTMHEYVGSRELREALERAKPKVLVCGHIHENGGEELLFKHEGTNTMCYNVSVVNEVYEPVKVTNFEI